MGSKSEIIFKLVLLGEPAVGKTSIRKSYLGEGFTGNYSMTIGSDLALKRAVYDDRNFTAQIWDLAGQSGFASFRKIYYTGAMGAIVVFDLSRPKTYERLDRWITEIIDNRGKMIPIILVGNKADLRGGEISMMSSVLGKEYAKALSDWSGFDIPYIETSALTGQNIDKAFKILLKEVDKQIAKDTKERERQVTHTKGRLPDPDTSRS